MPKKKPWQERPRPAPASLFGARRTFLFGDLGAGKSTRIGKFALEWMDRDAKMVALLVPAYALSAAPTADSEGFLRALERAIQSHVAPNLDVPELKKLFAGTDEYALLIDGLDEVELGTARKILTALERLSTHWSTVTVAVTGRPAELNTLNLGAWRRLSIAPLSADDRHRLFVAGAIASGRDSAEAEQWAEQVETHLARSPQLESLTTTPLVAKLVFARYGAGHELGEQTVGDLLHDVVTERLGNWDIRDDKEAGGLFQTAIPSVDARANILGSVAQRFSDAAQSSDALKRALKESLAAHADPTQELVASALSFFARSGLVSITATFEFANHLFWEICAAYGWIATRTGAEPITSTDPNWRVVSFAAAVLRRRGMLDQFFDTLAGFVKLTALCKSGLAAAAYVVQEARDERLARAWLDGAMAGGRRPLNLFFEEAEQSAHAQAQALVLAGDAGFDWFFSEYLDPRIPVINAGSWVIDRVLDAWAFAIRERLRPDQKQRLKFAIACHEKSPTLFSHRLFGSLATLIPEAFRAEDRVWLFTEALGSPLHAPAADKLLRDSYESHERELVDAALLARAGVGSSEAAGLWVELNPDPVGVPPEIPVAALKARARSRSRGRTLSDYSRSVLGETKWRALVTWYLTANDVDTAKGAALTYADSHDKAELAIIGSALLRTAREDHRDDTEVATLLTSVMEAAAARSLEDFARGVGDDDQFSSTPIQWRVLLNLLASATEPLPAMLVEALSGVKNTLMPRSAVVRQELRNLFDGPKGETYLRAVEAALDDPRPATRQGAARVLLISNSARRNEALSLLLATQSSGRGYRDNIWEWDEYCLSLPFSTAVLTDLHSRLPSLVGDGRGFALALLWKNGYALTEEERTELLNTVLTNFSWRDEVANPVLALSSSIPALKRAIEGKSISAARAAAAALIGFHEAALTPLELAKCKLLVTDKVRPGLLIHVGREAEEIRKTPALAEHVRTAAQDLRERGFGQPLLAAALEAITSGDEQWFEFVWNLFKREDFFSEVEDVGEGLLLYGAKFGGHQDAAAKIGRACAILRNDKRVEAAPYEPTRVWLALIAKAFGCLSDDDARDALRGHVAHHSSTACNGLIAYVGAPPDFVTPDRTAIPKLARAKPEAAPQPVAEWLRKCALPGESLHPEACSAIERALREITPTRELCESLAECGTHGALIGTALAVCMNQPVSESALAIAARSQHWLHSTREKSCFFRLSVYWRDELRRALADPSRRKRLREATIGRDQEFREEEVARIAYEAQEVISPESLAAIIRGLATARAFPESWSIAALADIVSAPLAQEDATILVAELERALPILDERSPEKDVDLQAPVALLFPLLYWTLNRPWTERTARVFIRGVIGITRNFFHRELDDSIAILRAVMARVPPEHIRKSIEYARTVSDVRMSTFALLISALSVRAG